MTGATIALMKQWSSLCNLVCHDYMIMRDESWRCCDAVMHWCCEKGTSNDCHKMSSKKGDVAKKCHKDQCFCHKIINFMTEIWLGPLNYLRNFSENGSFKFQRNFKFPSRTRDIGRTYQSGGHWKRTTENIRFQWCHLRFCWAKMSQERPVQTSIHVHVYAT